MAGLSEMQMKALAELSAAAERLEKARKELVDAQRHYDTKRDIAKRAAPYVFGVREVEED